MTFVKTYKAWTKMQLCTTCALSTMSWTQYTMTKDITSGVPKMQFQIPTADDLWGQRILFCWHSACREACIDVHLQYILLLCKKRPKPIKWQKTQQNERAKRASMMKVMQYQWRATAHSTDSRGLRWSLAVSGKGDNLWVAGRTRSYRHKTINHSCPVTQLRGKIPYNQCTFVMNEAQL